MTATKEPEASDGLEMSIATAWAGVLGIDEVAPDDNFFALGGDSFAAVRLLAAVDELTGVALTFADVLEAPVLQEFAARVAERAGKPTRTKRRRRNSTTAPMTFMQSWRWRVRKRNPTSAEVWWLYEIEGALDVDALSRAVDELAVRHEILRTVFRRRFGRRRQIVQPLQPGLLRLVDPSADGTKRLRSNEVTEAAQRVIAEDFETPFDYERGPLFRATLIVMGQQRYLFSFVGNEMVMDASCRGVVTASLSTLYALLAEGGSAEDYPYPPIQFRDYAWEQRARTKRSQHLSDLAYWRDKIRSLEPGVGLRGHTLPATIDWTVPIPDRTLDLSPKLHAEIRETARAFSMSTFNVLTAGFAVMFHAMADTDTPAFTTTIALGDVRGADQLIGTFYNVILIAVPLAGMSTADDLLRATSETTKEAFLHGHALFPEVERLRRVAPPDDSLLDTTHVRFQLHDEPGEFQFPGVRMRPVPPAFKSMHHFYVMATITARDGLAFYLSSRPDFPRQIVNNFLPAFRRVLELLSDDPGVELATLIDTASRGLGVSRFRPK